MWFRRRGHQLGIGVVLSSPGCWGGAWPGERGPVAPALGHADLSAGKDTTPPHPSAPKPAVEPGTLPSVGLPFGFSITSQSFSFPTQLSLPPHPAPHHPCQKGRTPCPTPQWNKTQAHFSSAIEVGSRGDGRWGKKQNMFPV